MTAAPKPFSIGIAGAGTAGLAASIALARAGHHVSVFEKHPGLSTLGAGLLIQPQGVHALQALGVGEAFERASVPIRRLLGKCHRGWTLVDIDYTDVLARSVGRAALAQVLYEAAQAAGVRFHFGDAVEQLHVDTGRARVEHSSGTSTFDVFAIADGAASMLRERAGLSAPSTTYRWGALWGQFWVPSWDAELLAQRYRGTSEMMGLLPTEATGQGVRLSFFWSLRGDRHAAWRSSDIEAWKAHVLTLWPEAEPVVRQIARHDDLTFAVYRHSWPRNLAGAPYCVMGDAAHAMSPQLGLGATLAVQDALALAGALNQHGAQRGLREYARRRQFPSRAYQTLSRALTPCFQAAGGGLWRDVAFAAGRWVPGVQWLMKRSVAEAVG